MPEWIEFHRKQGVEHFYLYNNLSDDNYKEILEPYIHNQLVTLTEWPYDYDTRYGWNNIQCNAYMDCAFNHNNDQWIAFIDTDEFIFCPNKTNLRTFLKQYKDCSALGIYWVMYGTSHVFLEENESLLSRLVMRAEFSNPHNKQIKTLARPKDISGFSNPHFPGLKNNKIVVNEDKKPMSNHTCSKIRCNHYWSRDMDFFYNVKLPRREKMYQDSDVCREWEKLFNVVYDPILQNFN